MVLIIKTLTCVVSASSGAVLRQVKLLLTAPALALGRHAIGIAAGFAGCAGDLGGAVRSRSGIGVAGIILGD